MALADDVDRIAVAAARYAGPGETVAAVLPVETADGERIYLCGFEDGNGTRSWIALDDAGAPVTVRSRVRDAASIAAIVEVAEESAGLPLTEEPRLASLSYLDSIGGTAENGLTGALQGAVPAVEELATDIEGNYKLELT